jgi:magnesium chelatase family protein
MLASVRTAAVFGIEAVAVSVEVDVSFGLPGLVMVGLPDAAVRESRDRVRSAIRNSGFAFPQHRVTVNLAPSGMRKGGAGLDLPIAVGLLVAMEVVPASAVTYHDNQPFVILQVKLGSYFRRCFLAFHAQPIFSSFTS